MEEFLARSPPGSWTLQQPEFERFEVRLLSRYLGRKYYPRILCVRTVYATTPGGGAWTRLLGWLRRHHPELPVEVDQVIAPRFQRGLERQGFTRDSRDSRDGPASYYWIPEG
jgi:hypothetical protein